jgi:hypothetical protein
VLPSSAEFFWLSSAVYVRCGRFFRSLPTLIYCDAPFLLLDSVLALPLANGRFWCGPILRVIKPSVTILDFIELVKHYFHPINSTL